MKNSSIFRKFFVLVCLVSAQVTASLADVCVTGAGSTDWNGTYVFNVSLGRYDLDGSHVLYQEFSSWVFRNSIGIGNPSAYTGADVDGVPEHSTFSVDTLGTSPAPVVSAGACPLPTSTPTVTPIPTGTPTATATVAPTATNTAASTTTPSLTPTLTPTPIADAKCISGDSNKKGKGLIGTYYFFDREGEDEGKRYRQLNGSGYLNIYKTKIFAGNILYSGIINGAADNISFEISSNTNILFAITYPHGFYSYIPPEIKDDNGQVVSGGKKNAVYLQVSDGVCPEIIPTPAPTNVISGSVTRPAAGQVFTRVVASGAVQPIYVLLYTGSAPTENSLPFSGALVNEDGSFTIPGVPDGDYHITFVSDGLDFPSDYIPLTALGGAPVALPPQAAVEVNYNDVGCKIASVGGSVLSTVTLIRVLQGKVQSQVNYLNSAAKGFSSTKAKKLSGKLATTTSATIRGVAESQFAAISFPATARTNCPAANGCSATSLKASVQKFLAAAKKLKSASAKIQKIGNKTFAKPGIQRKNLKLQKATSSAYNKAVKAIQKLPAVNQSCPVVTP